MRGVVVNLLVASADSMPWLLNLTDFNNLLGLNSS